MDEEENRIVTQAGQDLLRRQTPEPHMTVSYDIDDNGIRHEVKMTQEAERIGALNRGDRILAEAGQTLETDFSFASREGLAKAAFEAKAPNLVARDDFNMSSDEPNRLEHELRSSQDRFVETVDRFVNDFHNPKVEVTDEVIRDIEEQSRDLRETGYQYDSSRNNGLPLDASLDTERESYIRETTDGTRDHSTMSREEYVEATMELQSSHERSRDHDTDRGR